MAVSVTRAEILLATPDHRHNRRVPNFRNLRTFRSQRLVGKRPKAVPAQAVIDSDDAISPKDMDLLITDIGEYELRTDVARNLALIFWLL